MLTEKCLYCHSTNITHLGTSGPDLQEKKYICNDCQKQTLIKWKRTIHGYQKVLLLSNKK